MLAAAIAVALAFWGPPPCSALAVHVAELDPGIAGMTAVFPDGRCEVRIARIGWQWRWLCSTVLHEVGHLHGLPHSADPLSPMFPVLVRTADACRGRRPPQYPRGAVIWFP